MSVLILICTALFTVSSAQTSLPITAVILKDSGWNREKVTELFAAAQKVFAECRLRIDSPTFVEVESQAELNQLNKHEDTRNSQWTLAQLVEHLNLPRTGVTVYFVHELSDDSQTAFSRANFTITDRPMDPRLFNSVWFPEDVYTQSRTKPHSILAHELTHVYTLESGHFGDPKQPTILSISSLRNNVIQPYCDTIRRNAIP